MFSIIFDRAKHEYAAETFRLSILHNLEFLTKIFSSIFGKIRRAISLYEKVKIKKVLEEV